MAAGGQALQQRGAFSQRASWLMGLRSRVRAQALLVGFERGPVDIAFVMPGDEHGPLAARQHADALANDALFIDELLGARLAVGVGASIDGIAQHGVDRSVGGGDPAHRRARMRLQRKRQAFVAEPQPHATGRAELGEAIEDRAHGAADGGIRVQQDLAVGLAPDEAHRQAAAQLAARGLVANAAVQAGAQHVQLRFAHRALQAQQQTIVEQRRVVHAVGVADERVGHRAQVQQPIPVGVVARHARDLQPEDDAHVRQRHFGGHARKAAALMGRGAGQAEIFIDHGDPIGAPAQRRCALGQRVLARGGLAVVLDLRGRRLPHVDDRDAAQVRGLDLGVLTHRRAPQRAAPRRRPWR